MSKCIRCNVKEKEPGAYKYCKECKTISNHETEIRYRKNNRPPKLKLCEECNETRTKTKYCSGCKIKVHRRQNRERLRLIREKARGICERCEKNPKWSLNPTTKYCIDCKRFMKDEIVELKNKKMRSDRKERKKPVHKGVINDPTKQKPTMKEPLNSNEDDINPYFLRRKNA